jgi:hypothetical protein
MTLLITPDSGTEMMNLPPIVEARLIAIYRKENTVSGNPRWVCELLGSISKQTYLYKVEPDTQTSLNVPNFLGLEVQFTLNNRGNLASMELTMRQLENQSKRMVL